MTEEKNGLPNSAANSEMAPQEDGTKVPLTNDESAVKFTSGASPANGDAKVDMPEGQAFSGLTKDELMKYADDPFWVRLRWILFIIFWAGWVAMLVMAIVIIIQAPRCDPKKTLEWVQVSGMVQYDINNPVDADNSGTETPEDLVKMAADLGMTTVYLEDLISTENFENWNPSYDEKKLTAIMEMAKEKGLHVVTDFVPSDVPETNTWFNDHNMSDFFVSGTTKLDFSDQGLLDKLIELLGSTWRDRGVQGYLMTGATSEDEINATTTISAGLKSVDGVVVHGVVDVNKELSPDLSASSFRQFLDDHIEDWSYFKFNPVLAEGRIESDLVSLVTTSLFLVPGTPILSGLNKPFVEANKDFIKSLSEFRLSESVQVGDMAFANNTAEDVIAFARLMKGTPGCAVAVNMHPDNSTLVDFTTIEGVSDKGDAHINFSNSTFVSGELGRLDMSQVPLQPNSAVVLLFVPNL